MISLSSLRDAAFWSKDICLDCGAAQEGEDAPAFFLTPAVPEACPRCGGKLYAAVEVVEIFDRIEGEAE